MSYRAMSYRDEILDACVFETIDQVREITEDSVAFLAHFFEPLTFIPRPIAVRESRTYLKIIQLRHVVP